MNWKEKFLKRQLFTCSDLITVNETFLDYAAEKERVLL